MTACPPHETIPRFAARARSTGAPWDELPPEGRRASNLLQLPALPAQRRELRMRRRAASLPSRCVSCTLTASVHPSPPHTSSLLCTLVVTSLSSLAAGPTAALRARPKAAALPTETRLRRRRHHPETSRPAPRASRVSAPSTPSVARASHSPSPTVDRGAGADTGGGEEEGGRHAG